MPNSPHELHLGADNLRTYLEGVLPDARIAEATVDPDYLPLLLLQTNHVMAAFAFSNGDLNRSYDILYATFKSYYTQRQEQWDAFDLAFVFCVRPDAPDLDKFCSNVETDVYFCRKFVVALVAPLGIALARLPFLPLTPLHGKSMRPASAQTFLQQCGVPAVLAKFLVVQRERSPEGIVEDCASGEFDGPRELSTTSNTSIPQPERTGVPIQLEALTITNFRAYRKPQEFAIGADVTVLYGPNGFGKTSFFDAIDFVVTGGIGRLESSSEAHFKKTAKHLDSGSEDGVVSLSVRCNGALRNVTRRVSDRKQAQLDGRPTERKTILTELTGGDIPATDRVENFVSLFRATHLFSQEAQELTRDFQEDCRLSAEIVSRMLAFEDYANAVTKAARVCEVLEGIVLNSDTEARELSMQIAQEKKELDRLSQTARSHASMEALDSEVESLRSRLLTIGIAVGAQKPDAAIVRGWRASLEARHAESQSRGTRLSGLLKEAGALPQTQRDLTELQRELTQKEQNLRLIDQRRLIAEAALQGSEKRLRELATKIAEAETHRTSLEWLRVARAQHVRLLEQQRLCNEQQGRATETMAQLRTSQANTLTEQRKLANRITLATEQLKARRVQLASAQLLIGSMGRWQINRDRLAVVDESERTVVNSLESFRLEERELAPKVALVTAEEERLSRHVAEVDKSQSQLKALVSQLQGHVRSGTCPLCGEDHGSKDKLVERIQLHVSIDAATDARTDLAAVRMRATHQRELLAENRQKQRAATTQLSDLKEEQVMLKNDISEFATLAENLQIDLQGIEAPAAEQIRSLHSEIQQEIADLSQQVQMASDAAHSAQTQLTDIGHRLTASTATIANQEAELRRLQAEVARLRTDPRLNQMPLDSSEEQLAELDRRSRERLSECRAEMSNAQADVEQKRSDASALRQESAVLKNALSPLRNQVATLQRVIVQTSARMGEAKLPTDITEEALLALLGEESRLQAQLVAMRDSASSIELAIDAATTAAALTRLLQNIRIKERARATAERTSAQHKPWLKYFRELSSLISSQQNEAIATFTREYGPRASVIQRRLRSVYGFDEIELRSRESTISVRVKRHGEELRPTDYFSQSQQQTLLLGLFLTACSSQTWSAFSPVFLDDPVTHFDDLNTYAFLDLIVGLLESDFGRRQFVISTCDEKLLQLARQKFRHLGERAKFHCFSAIGADGPLIHETSIPMG